MPKAIGACLSVRPLLDHDGVVVADPVDLTVSLPCRTCELAFSCLRSRARPYWTLLESGGSQTQHALARTAGATHPAASRARRLPGAALLRRVFAQDVVFRPGGGRRTVVAFGRRRARRDPHLGQRGSAARPPTAPEVTPAVDSS
jgi:hypothetical protein